MGERTLKQVLDIKRIYFGNIEVMTCESTGCYRHRTTQGYKIAIMLHAIDVKSNSNNNKTAITERIRIILTTALQDYKQSHLEV